MAEAAAEETPSNEPLPIEQPASPAAITPRATSEKIFEKEQARIPKAPQIPKNFQVQGPENPFTCERQILYRGKLLPCDSARERDGQELRPIFHSVPESLSELDAYQKGRGSVARYAYVGTAGLGLALGGYLVSRSLSGTEALRARQIGIGGGLSLLALGTVFGLAHLQRNEQHLLNSIQIFNSRNPGDPIEIRFEAKLTP